MKFEYQAIVPKQSNAYTVFAFCAKASDILTFARIDRLARVENNTLTGFQRPQVANHIKEIRNYLVQEDAILPNSIVVAFLSGVSVAHTGGHAAQISIDVSSGVQGYIVDGQQRLSALQMLVDKEFEVFVTGLVCNDEEELRKQFILINNTKPLPKSLIYELLPSVKCLPARLASRSIAAALVERFNFEEDSSLHSLIKMQTNPLGIIQDTAMQKLIMQSLSDGVLRELSQQENGKNKCYRLINNYFKAVQQAFPEDWEGKSPKTSRLVHSAGIISMGYVMEHLHASTGARDVSEFKQALQWLKNKTSWSSGYWEFGPDNRRPWNSIQFVPRDYLELSQYLLKIIKQAQRSNNNMIRSN